MYNINSLIHYIVIVIATYVAIQEIRQYNRTKQIFHKMYNLFFITIIFIASIHLLWTINIGKNWTKNSVLDLGTGIVLFLGGIIAIYYFIQALRLKSQK